jgi:hypothetical protein
MTPDTLALSLILGFLLGLFPVYGCPTLFCIAAAASLKLNLPTLQMANYASTPLQLGLLVVFHQAGERLLRCFGLDIAIHLPGVPGWVEFLCTGVTQAVAGWFCLCAPTGILLYMALGYVLRRRLPIESCAMN